MKDSQFANVLTDDRVPLGGTIGLQVEITGKPTDVTWFRDNIRLPKLSPKHRTIVESGVHTLFFSNASVSDAGRYTCRITDIYGRLDTSAIVEVVNPRSVRNGKPAMFLSRPDKIMAVASGEDIVVSCRVTGDPKPKGIYYFLYDSCEN